MMSARTFFRTHASALAFSIVTLAVTVAAGAIFAGMHEAEPIVGLGE